MSAFYLFVFLFLTVSQLPFYTKDRSCCWKAATTETKDVEKVINSHQESGPTMADSSSQKDTHTSSENVHIPKSTLQQLGSDTDKGQR